MRFTLFGFEITGFKFVFYILGVMIWGRDNGRPVEGMTRHLVYISNDPIGWKYQFLFRSFHKTYMLRYIAVQEAIKNPKGRPVKQEPVRQRLAKLGKAETNQ